MILYTSTASASSARLSFPFEHFSLPLYHWSSTLSLYVQSSLKDIALSIDFPPCHKCHPLLISLHFKAHDSHCCFFVPFVMLSHAVSTVSWSSPSLSSFSSALKGFLSRLASGARDVLMSNTLRRRLVVVIACSFNLSSAITRWWSLRTSTPRWTLTSWRDRCRFLLTMTSSYWLTVCPFVDPQLSLWMPL